MFNRKAWIQTYQSTCLIFYLLQVNRATVRKALRDTGGVLLCPGGQAELVRAVERLQLAYYSVNPALLDLPWTRLSSGTACCKRTFPVVYQPA